jgi:hypothetical protein
MKDMLMTELERVAEAIRESEVYWWNRDDEPDDGLAETLAQAAIKALDEHRAAEKRRNCMHYRKTGSGSTGPNAHFTWQCPDCGESYDSRSHSNGVGTPE